MGVIPHRTTLQTKPMAIMYNNKKRMLMNAKECMDEVASFSTPLFLSIAEYSDNSKAFKIGSF